MMGLERNESWPKKGRRIPFLFLLIVCASFTTICSLAASAQNAPPSVASSASPQNAASGLTGFWALRFDSRNVPDASLAPTLTAKQIAAHKQNDAHAVRWCLYQGTPSMMDSGAPIDIVQGRNQVAISSEAPSAARHIYTDRSTRPDPKTFDETPDGFSLGHWEGDTLIVDTEGFSDTGYTGIPGGGFRTKTSQLHESYRLVDGGKELEVTFTWTDPKMFAKPHTYAFRYYRVPRGYNAGEFFCDSNDQERAGFLSHPPLPVK
jgi:hypothetical protein